MNQLDKLEVAIKHLYLSVAKLHDAFPERPFTPDGRMIGDIGEAIAKIKFNVIIDKKIGKHWDGCWKDSNGKEHKVQVKATQKDGTYLKEPPQEGTFLVFKILPDGAHEVIYNGSIMTVWKGIKQNGKEKMISLERLKNFKLESDAETIKIKN